MQKFFIIIVLFSFLISPVYAGVSTTTGFLSEQIWYSKDSFVEGETVKIYTAIWNGDKSSLSVKVEFYDKNVILGFRDVVIPPEQLQEVSVSWKVTSGDHTISAKIISSTLNTTSGKKETVILENNITSSDKKFVPVVVKKEDGKTSTSNDVVNDELIKVGEKINDIVPASVSEPFLSGLDSVDVFRNETLTKILANKEKTQEKILSYENTSEDTKTSIVDKVLTENKTIQKAKTLEEATEKPIANVKLFFLKVLEFIFSHKLIFYGLIILIIYYILRSIYRKIRNR